MRKKSFVLKALRILGLEEMLKLSEILNSNEVPLKQVAGGEFIVEEAPKSKPRPNKKYSKSAKILKFPDKLMPEKETDSEDGDSSLMSSEIILGNLALRKMTENELLKKRGFSGYKKITDSYMIKDQDEEGKESIRFASTQGVLINKKQA